ncbi:baseplate assembly protein [Orbus mooreae]|uniref:baseplate assembly protein n=1 Tax=Orbus mooreae TaxID=3074107 RepID=UPI00370D7B06
MTTNYNQLLSLPDVNFTETDSAIILQNLIDDYQLITKKVLYPGDPVRLFLYTLAYRISQERAIYNNAGRQTLLRYAKKDKLDHIGALMGTSRIQHEYAKLTIKYSLSSILSFDVVIPQGSRVTTLDGDAIFAINSEAIVKSGSLSVDVLATSLTAGTKDNNIQLDEVNVMVDPIAYVSSVTNTTISAGGTDIESDEDYRERIALSPERFSTAGPELAYKYHALSAHKNISSVAALLKEPGIVEIVVLLENGIIPDSHSVEIEAVIHTLNDEKIRPLTDTVEVVPAEAILCDYELTWYLPQSSSSLQAVIAEKVALAVSDYEKWQVSTLGRDINPDELISLCKAAGAKRIELSGLNYTSLEANQVCQFKSNINRIRYGGIERSA